MLLSLKIENYALIKHCEIDFENNFSAITGETGAGKSILLGALALAMGQRADSNVLMDKQKKCVIEAVFEVKKEFEKIFEDNDADYEPQSIFRREILPNGKSRAFVNDTPVRSGFIRELADRLIDIHSQSSTTKLRDGVFQLELVDTMVENKDFLNQYRKIYKNYRDLCSEIDELTAQRSEAEKERSYNEFIFEELKNAKLKKDEQEELEKESELMCHSEQIKTFLSECIEIVDNESENSVLSYLGEVKNKLSKIAPYAEILRQSLERTQSAIIEIGDILSDMRTYNDGLFFDQEKMDQIDTRLDTIYNLERKHNVQSVAELLEIEKSLQEKLDLNNNTDAILKQKQEQKELCVKQLESLSEQIHEQRLKAANLICQSVKEPLCSMKMKDAVLKIEFVKSPTFNENGCESVCFLFSANKTKDNSLCELGKVISGGELSRLMLAIKSVVAECFEMPTMIFDEIDSGISGDVASKAGEIMKKIGRRHQVIVISHLAQVVAKADNQYKVYKQDDGEQTVSNIEHLDKKQRIEEIALMLSDGRLSKAALANAEQLLNYKQ